MATPAQFDLLGFPITTPAAAPIAAYGRYRTTEVRHTCARCQAARHAAEKHGQPPAPMRAVAWRRQCGGPDTVTYLCYRHKAEAHAEDNAAGRLAKQTPGRRTARVTA